MNRRTSYPVFGSRILVLLLGFAVVNLLGMVIPASAVAQELTLYTFPPPRPLNWASPFTLSFGAGVGNRFTFSHIKHKHTFGHVFIELRGPNGERWLTGSTTAPDAPSDADYVTKRGYGLGVLFTGLQGALDPAPGLDAELVDRYQSGRVAFMTFKLKPATFVRMARFLKEYQERGYHKIYNGLNRPREGLGAGCSIFGMAFLEIGGLMRPEYPRDWVVSVRIPEHLIGGPATGRRVSLFKAMTGRWAREDEPHRVLSLYDPQLMYVWINKEYQKRRFDQVLHRSPGNDRGSGVQPAPARPESAGPRDIVGRYFPIKPVARGKALGLEIDCTRMPTPTEPLFLR